MQTIFKHRVYGHFKGKLYYVEDFATNPDGECFVIYRALYGDFALYVRPFIEFSSDVSYEQLRKYHQKERFTLCTDITEGEM